jgi:hypothetical protein
VTQITGQPVVTAPARLIEIWNSTVLYSARKKRPADEPPGGRSKFCPGSLEKAEYDGSDEGEREIGGDNAEPAAKRTDQAHGGVLPWFTSCPHND